MVGYAGSKIRNIVQDFHPEARGEECRIRSGRFLLVTRYVGLRDALLGLERHVETESAEEQLSGSSFHYLEFGGR